MDYNRRPLLVLAAVIFTAALVSGQADMSVTYTSNNWFPVGENTTFTCQVEHTENRDALSVYWSRKNEDSTYAKIGAYDSRDNSTYKYASAPKDIADRFMFPEGKAYDDELLTATSYIFDTTLSDAGTYQCEVEDTKAHMAKASAFEVNVYSLPSSVSVVDGLTSLSTLPEVVASGDGAAEEAEAEAPQPIASCVVAGVFPAPAQIEFFDDSGNVLQTVTEFTSSTGDDGLFTVTADLFMEATKELNGISITCSATMAEGIDTVIDAENYSSVIEVLYATDEVTFTITDDGYVNEYDMVTLSCSGNGNPAPEVVISGQDGAVITELTFAAQYVHQGEYTCTAGGITEMKVLGVNFIRDPTIEVGSDPEVYQVGDQLSVTCEANGSPEPTYKWLQNNQVVADSRYLSISPVEKTSAGEYVCVASNKAGETEMNYNVQVQYGCTATMTSKVSYSKQGGGKAHVVVTCTAEGDPECEVTISGNDCDESGMGRAECIRPNMTPVTKAPKFFCTASNGVGTAYETAISVDDEPLCCGQQSSSDVAEAGMPAGGIAAIIIIIALVVIGVPAACYFCRRQRTPSTKTAKAMEAGEDEKLADAENQE